MSDDINNVGGDVRAKVLIVKFAPLNRDPRVLRQIALLRQFAQVTTVGFGPAPKLVDDHIEIRAQYSSWRSNRLVLAALYALRWHQRLYFSSPRVKHVLDAVAPGSFDVIVANDALAVPLALALKPRRGVHADLHEFSPRQGFGQMWRLLVAPYMHWACRQLTDVNSASTVAPGIAAEYQRVYQVACDVVPNASEFRADLAPTQPQFPLRLVHIGIAGRARRLEVMLDAVIAAERNKPGRFIFDMYLAEGDPSYIAQLRARVADSGCPNVRVLDPVAYDQIVDTLAKYDLGMFVCPATTFNLAHALPNKFFEFVQARLGVVIGPSVEMAHYVKQYKMGVIASGFDAGSIRAVLESLSLSQVSRLKEASDHCAEELSSQRTATPWQTRVLALLNQDKDEQ